MIKYMLKEQTTESKKNFFWAIDLGLLEYEPYSHSFEYEFNKIARKLICKWKEGPGGRIRLDGICKCCFCNLD
jgi:hypothetical protein